MGFGKARLRIKDVRAGFTLVETSVSLFLLALVCLLCMRFTRPLALISRHSLERWECQQQALVALSSMRKLLQDSAPGGLSGGSDWFSVNTLDDPRCDNSTGRLRWKPSVQLFYRHVDASLRRRSWPPVQSGDPPLPVWMGSLTLPKRLSPQQASDLRLGSPEKVLCRGVDQFQLEGLVSDGTVRQPLQLKIRLSRSGKSFAFRRSVWLMGSW